jgi:hypothetical protein
VLVQEHSDVVDAEALLCGPDRRLQQAVEVQLRRRIAYDSESRLRSMATSTASLACRAYVSIRRRLSGPGRNPSRGRSTHKMPWSCSSRSWSGAKSMS